MAYLAGFILLLVVALVAYIATRPNEYRVQRTAQVGAPADVVFSIINDLHQWGRWSPYDHRDPNMKTTHDGPATGPGSVYTWNGNGHVGEGRMTIVESRPGEMVAMKLEFVRPFQCTNAVNFTLAPADGGTRVSWIMDGRNTLFSKAMSLVMSMDKMVGKDFEQGLANLDQFAREEMQKLKESVGNR